jgi:hypothetical protein
MVGVNSSPPINTQPVSTLTPKQKKDLAFLAFKKLEAIINDENFGYPGVKVTHNPKTGEVTIIFPKNYTSGCQQSILDQLIEQELKGPGNTFRSSRKVTFEPIEGKQREYRLSF